MFFRRPRTLGFLLILWLGIASTCFAQAPTWTGIGPGGGNVHTLAIDPVTPTTLYVGTQGGGAFKSTNGGVTWSAINNGLLLNAVVEALTVDPVTPTTLYAGTGRDGVFKSTDAGATWSATNTGLTTPSGVLALAIDPAKRVEVGG